MAPSTRFGRTVSGTTFEYSGSLTDGLVVYFRDSGTEMRISTETIKVIRREIAMRSPVHMGANRDGMTESVGKTLRDEYRLSPQNLSYVVPLLAEEGFCRVDKVGRAFVLRAR